MFRYSPRYLCIYLETLKRFSYKFLHGFLQKFHQGLLRIYSNFCSWIIIVIFPVMLYEEFSVTPVKITAESLPWHLLENVPRNSFVITFREFSSSSRYSVKKKTAKFFFPKFARWFPFFISAGFSSEFFSFEDFCMLFRSEIV